MPRNELIITVFVSSPEDVKDERLALEEITREINTTWSKRQGGRLDLVKWETHAMPGVGRDAQAVIDRQIGDDYDVFVGILWKRFGTPTASAGSGTEAEFTKAYERWRKDPDAVSIMFYFKDAPVPPSEMDPQQLSEIQRFRDGLGEKGTLYRFYKDLDEFAKLLRIHLGMQLQRCTQNQRSRLAPADHGLSVPESRLEAARPEDGVSTEEPGLIDFLEVGQEQIGVFTESSARIVAAMEESRRAAEERTEETRTLQESEAPLEVKQFKKIVNRAAEDLERLATRIDAEIPIFCRAFSQGFDALAQAIIIQADLGSADRQEFDEAVRAAEQALGSAVEAKEAIVGFRRVIAALPRVTTRLNRAKRRTADSLSCLEREMDKALALTEETLKSLKSIRARGSDPG